MNYQGLTSAEVEELRAQHGPNSLPEPKPTGPLLIFFRQFLSPFIYILLVAAVVSFWLKESSSSIFILLVLFINAIIGTIQEYSAERSAAALRKMVKGIAHVIRDGINVTVDVEDLVPGDLVLLSSGDKVPADIRLHHVVNLEVDESMLTGESVSVQKRVDTEVASDAPVTERVNECFAGSIVTRGRASGLVTATGSRTQLGRIARDVTRARESEPPLIIRIRRFTYQVAGAIMVAIVLLVILMAIKGGYHMEEMFLMSIGLAVSAIPEGLPAAITVALAIGMRRMASLNVIIRKLVAVEALGSCTCICSDKTGTLTVNELTIRRAVLPDSKEYEITGEGVAPGGDIVSEHDLEHLRDLCLTGVLANESHLDYAGGEWVSDGDIVDVAFLVLAKKLGSSLSEIRRARAQRDLLPYESEKALSASLNHITEDSLALHVKGSPEKILELSTEMWTPDGPVPVDRELIERQFESLAASGYRVIALAHRSAAPERVDEQLHSLVFLGMVAMIDPIRPEAREAIQKCRNGGIEVAMITGDHPATARAIALELGLCTEEEPVVNGRTLRDAAEKSPESLDQLIMSSRVFARIEPHQKEQIVQCFRRNGHFVAVTGDGVNDAPAMRGANAGIAMGKRGTDVARESADLIITDDNFASIVSGISQGRIVYNNIRKVIAMLAATGVSALLLFFLCVMGGLPMPMIAVQLLWLNLVANGLQDVALAFEPSEGNELDYRPRRPDEPIFNRQILMHVVFAGITMGLIAFFSFRWFVNSGEDIETARSLTLTLMVLFGNVHALNSRSEIKSLFRIPLFSNPFLIAAVPLAQLIHIGAIYTPWIGDILELRPISLAQWGTMACMALVLLGVEEIVKLWLRRHQKGLATSSR